METSIIIAGFGGQGVLLAGQLLAYAGMDNGRYVTWIPSYGPEMRGGTANCTVIISSEPIGAPIVTHPDVAVVLNQPSFTKYAPLVKPKGLLLINSSIVKPASQRTDIDVVYVPAHELAEEFGTIKMINVAMLGALLAQRPLLPPLETLATALAHHLPTNKGHLLEANLAVLRYSFTAFSPITV